MPKATIKPADFASLYEGFTAPVSRFDCGRKCAPLNGGEPVCCSTQNAVPVVHKVEFDLLKSRTDLWSKFKPYDYATRQIVAELTSDCMAIHCKGARHCERDNRTIACRGFPFYPYLTRERQFVGVGTYWVFEDRCWMMSNLEIVDRAFVEQFIATYEALFIKDNSEFTTYVDFSRLGAARLFALEARDPAARPPGRASDRRALDRRDPPRPQEGLPKVAPFSSEKEYREAVKEAGGEVPKEGLRAA